MNGNALMAAAALAAMCGAAAAGPDFLHGRPGTADKRPIMLANVLDSNFTEAFDGYAAGSGIAGQNGWLLWDGLALDGVVTASTASSAPHSFESFVNTDVVQLFDITSGVWELSVQTFVPSTQVGSGYVIMLNTFEYPHNATTARWSLQIEFNPAMFWVQSQWGNETAPLVFDQWVELRAEIDLDATPDGLLNVWYNGQQFVFDRPWNGNTSGSAGGAVRIQCLDLYAPGAGFKWDDVKLTQMGACYPNCDASTVPPILNVDDFTCFINEFAAAQALPHAQQVTSYPNCDGSSIAPALNVDDFTCFINAFAAGCP